MRNKFYGVLGLGRSGQATLEFLLKHNIKFIAWDDGEETRANIARDFPAINLVDETDTQWLTINCLIISPGIPTEFANAHPLATKLKQLQIPIICDIELLYQANKEARFIAITGTNGKSTTTALIGHILADNHVQTCVGGNIGTGALSLESLDSNGVYVIETSSYQLMLLNQTHFNVSILLNITPDHLERHQTMENYTNAKCNIFNQQDQNDCAIISVDNKITNEIHNRLEHKGEIGNLLPISTKQKLAHGITVIDGQLECSNPPYHCILPTMPHLKGDHNAQNIAAAFAAAAFIGIKPKDIIKSITSFPGLAHRLQFIARHQGLSFFNDSKGTNAESTEKALMSFPDNIYWIVGGRAKEGGIEILRPLFNRVKHAFVIGEAQEDFVKTLGGTVAYTKAGTLANAFALTTAMASADQDAAEKIILLSPACASWDQWKSFEARGEAFCHLVREFCNK